MKNRTSSKDATASDVTVSSPSFGRRLTALLVAFTLTVQTLPAFAGVYYIHTDHLDTPRAVTNQQNQVVWQNLPLTEPFGTSAPNEDPDGDGQTFTLNLRFPGQYFDQETGTHYNYYRDHYFPSLGRYGQSDPIGLYGGINTYSYVNGNPLIFVDPEGELLLECAVAGLIGGAAWTSGMALCVQKGMTECKRLFPGGLVSTSPDAQPYSACQEYVVNNCGFFTWWDANIVSQIGQLGAEGFRQLSADNDAAKQREMRAKVGKSNREEIRKLNNNYPGQFTQ